MRSLMLTRYFVLLSLLLVGIAGVLLSVFVHQHQVQQMEHLAQDRNVLTAKVFQQLFLQDVKDLVRTVTDLPVEALDQTPELVSLRERLKPLIEKTDIVKVKVYDLQGLTIFSTETAQIGESKADNAGFQQALGGEVASELTHRDQFSAFDGVRNNLDLVSSYLPVYENGQVVAIFELYQEVTNLMKEITGTRLTISLLIGSVLFALFSFQWLVVHRAQRILVAHEQQLLRDKTKLGEQFEESAQALIESKGTIQRLHTHDQLTGLPNRLLFHERLKQGMRLSMADQSGLAVLFIDLDDFSALNDSRGHDVGDRLLCQVARDLDACVRDGDALARLGGDEFAFLIKCHETTPEHAVETVMRIGERLMATIRTAYRLPNGQFQGTGSLGVSCFVDGESTPETLMQQAELAMYRSKEAGKDRLTFFDPSMAEQLLQRTRLEAELRQAIAEDELQLYFQPLVNGRDGRVMGAEALVRWQHPNSGLLGPDAFIPLAEKTGLIVPLGQWVLQQACKQLVRWQAMPALAHLTVSVNVSVQQFCQPDFSETVATVLQDTGVNPTGLKLELTESLFAKDLSSIVATMTTLRALGIGFSLDDFGTGYSSLAYLSQLPLDQLKIDRAFVHDIGEVDDSITICLAILSLARGLGLKVVAEGVETEVQRYILGVVHHCDQLQGYLFSRPVPVADFEVYALQNSERQRHVRTPRGQSTPGSPDNTAVP